MLGRGDEGDDAHLGVTERAGQREDFIDARQQHGPPIAGGGAVGRIVGRAGGRRRHGHRRQGGDGGAQGGVGGQHAVVAVAVDARRWHQRGNLVDQFERGQHQGAGSVRARLGDVVEQMLGVVLVQMLEGERRAGAVAQQPFPPGPVGALDAHRGVEREAAAVVPAAHLVTSTLLEQAAADAGAQHPLAHLGLHRGQQRPHPARRRRETPPRRPVRGVGQPRIPRRGCSSESAGARSGTSRSGG